MGKRANDAMREFVAEQARKELAEIEASGRSEEEKQVRQAVVVKRLAKYGMEA